MSTGKYDVIVVGAGHAGVEAALAAARIGCSTLLLTHNIDTIGQMSCNPAVGGIGKGHLVKEVDALGGIMAIAADASGIQFRTLNSRKGPAVRATRAQTDRQLYKQAIQSKVFQQKNLTVFQQSVDDIILSGDQVQGVVTQLGLKFFSRSVVLTTGTFLNGQLHTGLQSYSGGRAGDPPSVSLANRLREMPVRFGRLKTGTPPRLDAKTIDFSKLQVQHGDDPRPVFSFLGCVEDHPKQTPCYITHTNETTHQIIKDYLHQSPMYSGEIEGVGPRYCPSVEDKVMRFSDKNSHQIFVEPEGLASPEIYPNGISTSLPFDAQIKIVNSIYGFEKTKILRPGYAIEYDYFDPRDLKNSLETKSIKGLFFAGQINGTTGYEEAAAQGLLAGLNAARQSKELPAWTPRRDEAYLGVLVDDLSTLGTKEPYRMFTSRAEYRLLLREDNADIRLTEQGYRMGLVHETRWANFCAKQESIELEMQRLRSHRVNPNSVLAEQLNPLLNTKLTKEATYEELLKRPDMDYQKLMSISDCGPKVKCSKVSEQIEIQVKYDGYIKRQLNEVQKILRHELSGLPTELDYGSIQGLSNEVVTKLNLHKPETVGQASRISGVTPAAISMILIHLKKLGLLRKASVESSEEVGVNSAS